MSKKMKFVWWSLTGDKASALHAVRPDRDKALCGGLISADSVMVTGPKTIERATKCRRCESQLERLSMMS